MNCSVKLNFWGQNKMNVFLITLGVLGFGAILISVYVFTVAARNYVSDDHPNQNTRSHPGNDDLIECNTQGRRSNQSAQFPLTVQGVLVTQERRQLTDRRRVMAA